MDGSIILTSSNVCWVWEDVVRETSVDSLFWHQHHLRNLFAGDTPPNVLAKERIMLWISF